MGKEKYIAGYHAKTEREAKHICRCLHYKGQKWSDGSSYLKYDNWFRYKEQTVYAPFMNKFVNVDWCNKSGVEILPYNAINVTTMEIFMYYLKKYSWILILFLIAMLFLSCSKEEDCECDLITYRKEVILVDVFTPDPDMDTVSFSGEAHKIEPYENDCNNHNLMIENDYFDVDLPRKKTRIFEREIVKCN